MSTVYTASRKQVLRLFVALDFTTTETWNEKKTLEKISQLPQILDEENRPKDAALAKLADELVAAVNADQKIELTDKGGKDDAAPAPAKTSKAKAEAAEAPAKKTGKGKTAKAAKNKHAKKAKAAGGERATVLGQSVTGLIRWMGKEGWDAETATLVMADLGQQPAARTIQTFLYAGRHSGKTVLGTAPKLDKAASDKLNSLAKKHGGPNKKAARQTPKKAKGKKAKAAKK